MNHAPRGLNRVLLVIFGLVLLAAGAAALALAFVPDLRTLWSDNAGGVVDGVDEALKAAPLGETGHSVWLLAAVAACVLLIILGLVLLSRQGGGRTKQVLRQKPNPSRTAAGAPAGGIVLDVSAANDALTEALQAHPAVLASSVTAHEHARTVTLRIATTVRTDASPGQVADTATNLVRSWNAAVGAETPAVIVINSGLRSALSSNTGRVR